MLFVYFLFPAGAFADAENISYVVKKGDCLSEIAHAHKIKTSSLYFDNKKIIGSNPHLIHPGQILNIRAKDTANKMASRQSAAVTTSASENTAGNFDIAANNREISELRKQLELSSLAKTIATGNDKASLRPLYSRASKPAHDLSKNIIIEWLSQRILYGLIGRYTHETIVVAALSTFVGVFYLVFQSLLWFADGRRKIAASETENFDPQKLYVGSFIYNGSLLDFAIDDSQAIACPLTGLADFIAASDKFSSVDQLVFKLDGLREELSKIIHVQPECIRNFSSSKRKLLLRAIESRRNENLSYGGKLSHA